MVDFPAYFAGMEQRLVTELRMIRASITHATNKGAKAESAFRTFLTDHLPRSLEVGHGEAIDQCGNVAGSKGGGAHQIDAMVISDAHPRFGKIEEPATYFIEGVRAAGEVKASLKLGDIETIVAQAAAFKNLTAPLGSGDLTFSHEADLQRFHYKRPYFLFCFESKATPNSIFQRILAIEAKMGLKSEGHLDAVFALDRGALINCGDGRNSFKLLIDGEPTIGWGYAGKDTLMTMISWLSAVMPHITHQSSMVLPYLIPKRSRVTDDSLRGI